MTPPQLPCLQIDVVERSTPYSCPPVLPISSSCDLHIVPWPVFKIHQDTFIYVNAARRIQFYKLKLIIQVYSQNYNFSNVAQERCMHTYTVDKQQFSNCTSTNTLSTYFI